MADPQLILRTKLHSPPTPWDFVPRPHLYARLDEGLRCPVILLTAPAGFGKSTLLSAWLARLTCLQHGFRSMRETTISPSS